MWTTRCGRAKGPFSVPCSLINLWRRALQQLHALITKPTVLRPAPNSAVEAGEGERTRPGLPGGSEGKASEETGAGWAAPAAGKGAPPPGRGPGPGTGPRGNAQEPGTDRGPAVFPSAPPAHSPGPPARRELRLQPPSPTAPHFGLNPRRPANPSVLSTLPASHWLRSPGG